MLKLVPLVLLTLFPLFTHSQESTIIKAGGGIPVFTQPFFPKHWEPERFSGFPRIALFVEKSNLLPVTLQYNFSLNTGVSFFYMEQYEGPGSGLGGGSELDLKRYSLSAYLKFLYHFTGNETSKHSWYAGTVAGVQVLRKTEGKYSWWMRQQGGYATGGNLINQSDDDFFNPFYVGFIVGISPARNSGQLLKPGIELSFYPDFIINNVKPYGSYARRGSIGMAVVSVVFGIGN